MFVRSDAVLKYAWEQADLILAENSLRRAVGAGGRTGELVTAQQSQAQMKRVLLD